MQETEAVERTERSIIFYTHTYKISRVHYFIREVLQVALRDAVTLYDVSSKRDVSYSGGEAESVPDRINFWRSGQWSHAQKYLQSSVKQ